MRKADNVALLCVAGIVLTVLWANSSALFPSAAYKAGPVVMPRQTFADVLPTHTFWLPVERASDHLVMGGYPCGTVGEPCDTQRRPYFRWAQNMSLGDVVQALAGAGGYGDPPASQTFSDVPPSSPLYRSVAQITLAHRGIFIGTPCGGPQEPCDSARRPYIHPERSVSRLRAIQIMAAAKGYDEDPTVQTFTDIPPASSYYRGVEQAVAHILVSGYGCGGPDEPCDDRRRLYFRGDNPVTRSQFAKIITIAEGYNEYPATAH